MDVFLFWAMTLPVIAALWGITAIGGWLAYQLIREEFNGL